MLNELLSFFQRHGYEVKIIEGELLFVIGIEGEDVKLSVKVPEDYPFVFLDVYIINKSELSFTIPHMIVGNQICLYDLDSDRHDYKNHLEEAKETIDRAQSLLVSAKIGELKDEYKNEFYDLWTTKGESSLYSLIENYQSSSKLTVLRCTKANKVSLLAIEKPIDSSFIVNLLQNLSLELVDISNAIYIPVQNSKLNYPIETVGDLINFIRREKSFSFFTKEIFNNTSLILLGINSDYIATPTMVALVLPKMTMPKVFRKKRKVFKSILKFNGKKRIVRLGLTDLSQDRLLTRGGEGKKDDKIKVYIAGCGSLGSFISKSLCDTGHVSELILQDNQILKSENIGRHLCGIDHLNKFKTEAVSSRINSNFPSMEITTINESFIQQLKEKEELENFSYDLFICATGDENIEEQIIKQVENGIMKGPILIVWVEPYLVAGHAILINSVVNQNTKNYLFDSEGNIKLSVVNNADAYSKSEVGCQSRFMPYSGFEMQMFTQIIVDNLINNDLMHKNGNFHITWFGKMKEARNNNISISSRWRHKNDRELLVNRIDK